LCTTASSSAHRAHSALKCAKKAFPLKIFSRTKSCRKTEYSFGKVKIEVLYFVCELHLLAVYTFAVSTSRLLRYNKLNFDA
jgi:hypothetical protein